MPGPPSESDYGSELDWTDATLDAALTAIERSAANAAVSAASTSRGALDAGHSNTGSTITAQGGVVTAGGFADPAATATREASPPASLW